MAPPPKLDRPRLVKVLGMLGSRHDGEVLAAARLAQYMLGQSKTTWADLLDVEPGTEPDPLPQEDAGDADRKRDAFGDPPYEQMLKTLLKNRVLDARTRKRLEGMEDRIQSGVELALDDKLLLRWLYHTAAAKGGAKK